MLYEMESGDKARVYSESSPPSELRIGDVVVLGDRGYDVSNNRHGVTLTSRWGGLDLVLPTRRGVKEIVARCLDYEPLMYGSYPVLRSEDDVCRFVSEIYKVSKGERAADEMLDRAIEDEDFDLDILMTYSTFISEDELRARLRDLRQELEVKKVEAKRVEEVLTKLEDAD